MDFIYDMKGHRLVALVGLVWCTIWISVLSSEIAYLNQNYVSPAGKVALNSFTEVQNSNCVYAPGKKTSCGYDLTG